ncbi:MAG: glycosyltransferase family 39 protein [Anaerolineae bacterium]
MHTIDYLMRLPSSLNPYDAGLYTYGGLSLYLYLFTARLFSWLFHSPVWTDNKWHVTLIARGYSAIASTLIIALLYRLSRLAGIRHAAWVPAFAFAVSPLAVQYAHYGVVDTLLTFWVVLFSVVAVWCWKRQARWGWVMAGFVLGLAIATKTTGAVWGISLIYATWTRWRETRDGLASLSILVFGIIGVGLGVMSGSPYYILDWSSFRYVMEMQAGKTVTGRILCTYHWQFLNVRPFLFEVEQLARWAMGTPLAILGGVGAFGLGFKTIQRRKYLLGIVLLAPAAYFAFIGLWHSKFIRYLLPVIPFVSLCAAWPLEVLVRTNSRVLRWIVTLVIGGALLYSAILGLAVANIYTGPDPRIAASEWMLTNIPPGATILHDPEPLITLPLGAADRYQIETFDLYGNRMQNINNPEFYLQHLRGKQYIVIVSRRNYGAVYHLHALFPVAASFYRSVFDGCLGFSLVARFTNYPRVGWWTWNTDEAEETFQVFDHPVVYIFQRSIVSDENARRVWEQCLSR